MFSMPPPSGRLHPIALARPGVIPPAHNALPSFHWTSGTSRATLVLTERGTALVTTHSPPRKPRTANSATGDDDQPQVPT